MRLKHVSNMVGTICKHVERYSGEVKPVWFRGKLYPSEYKRHFETERFVAEIKPEPNEPNKLRMMIDGISDVTWFRQKQREFLQKIGINVNQKPRESKGIKM